MPNDTPMPRSPLFDRIALAFLAAAALVVAYRAIPSLLASPEVASTGQALWSWQGAALILAGVAFVYYGYRVTVSADETPRSVWLPLILSAIIMVLVFPTLPLLPPAASAPSPSLAQASVEARTHLRDFEFLLFGLALGFFFGNATRKRQPKPPSA